MPSPEDHLQHPTLPPHRNPLAVIGSFLTLIYALGVVATGVLVCSPDPRFIPMLWVMVIFLITYSLCSLVVLTWLVGRHSAKLYSPAEFGEHQPSCQCPAPDVKRKPR